MRLCAVCLRFLCVLSAFSFFSCNGDKFSGDYNEAHLNCGSQIKGNYLKILSEDGRKSLDGDSFKVIVRDKDGTIHENHPTKEGCVTEDMIKGASSVLIRKGVRKAKVLDPQNMPWRKRVKLVNSPKVKPGSGCGPQNIMSGILNPHDFIDTDGVEWGNFYYLMARLENEKGEVFPLNDRPLEGGDRWDISDFEEGKYWLFININNGVHGGVLAEVKCPIDTQKHKLFVEPGDKIKEYREYFGQEYAVVEHKKDGSPYYVNFYEAGLNNIDVEYCLQKIVDPSNVGDLDFDCSFHERLKNGEQVTGQPLEDGFWNLSYRYSKGEIESGWQSNRIMVKKICEGGGIFPIWIEYGKWGVPIFEEASSFRARVLLILEKNLKKSPVLIAN